MWSGGGWMCMCWWWRWWLWWGTVPTQPCWYTRRQSQESDEDDGNKSEGDDFAMDSNRKNTHAHWRRDRWIGDEGGEKTRESKEKQSMLMVMIMMMRPTKEHCWQPISVDQPTWRCGEEGHAGGHFWRQTEEKVWSATFSVKCWRWNGN